MTSARNIIRIAAMAAFAVVASFGVWRSVSNALGLLSGYEQPQMIAESRRIASQVSAGQAYFWCYDAESLSPAERVLLIALNWERSPFALKNVTTDGLADCPGPLFARTDLPTYEDVLFNDAGFSLKKGNRYLGVWEKTGAESVSADGSIDAFEGKPWLRHAVAVAVIAGLTLSVWFLVGGRRKICLGAAVASIAVMCLLATIAVRSGLMSPNGLATYGGKAKLFLQTGGVPTGFWTAGEYLPYQPSYPFAMIVPAMAAFAVSGSFDCPAAQVFVPIVLGLLAFEILSCLDVASILERACVSILAVLYVMSPTAVHLAAGYYAEPLAALLLVMGWKALSECRTALGWGLAGASALVRPEGLLVAFVMWTVCFLFYRRWCVSRSLGVAPALLLALGPGIAWNAFCLVMGARLEGYDFGSLPHVENIVKAFAVAIRTSFFDVRECAGVVLLLLFFPFVRVPLLRRNCLAAGMFACMALVVGFFMLGFASPIDFEWIAEMTVPRYVWLSLAVPICMVATATTERLEAVDEDCS